MTLVARATDAKIRLRRIKHRRVQTAAVVLCRGVYIHWPGGAVSHAEG